MSFDFDIKVRINDKLIGDIISAPKVIPAPASLYAGYKTICWWNSSLFLDLPPAIFKICCKYTNEQYTIEEGFEGNAYIFVPRAALREICSYIFSRSCVSDSELTEKRDWSWWEGYEVTNQAKAEELKNFCARLIQSKTIMRILELRKTLLPIFKREKNSKAIRRDMNLSLCLIIIIVVRDNNRIV